MPIKCTCERRIDIVEGKSKSSRPLGEFLLHTLTRSEPWAIRAAVAMLRAPPFIPSFLPSRVVVVSAVDFIGTQTMLWTVASFCKGSDDGQASAPSKEATEGTFRKNPRSEIQGSAC